MRFLNIFYAGLPHQFSFRGELITLTELRLQDDALIVAVDPPNELVEDIIRKVMADRPPNFNPTKIQDALSSFIS